jgi:hypothetical protein
MDKTPLQANRAQALVRAVAAAGERVGDAMTAAGDYDDLDDVPREAWETVAEGALKLWAAATAAASVAEGGETGD